MHRVAERFVKAGSTASGLVNLKRTEGGRIVGIDGVDLRTGERFRFADRGDRADAAPIAATVGNYRVLQSGVARALDALGNHAGSDLHVFDEVGRLELRGEGLAPALTLLADPAVERLIVVARKELADRVAALPTAVPWKVIDLTPENREGSVGCVLAALSEDG